MHCPLNKSFGVTLQIVIVSCNTYEQIAMKFECMIVQTNVHLCVQYEYVIVSVYQDIDVQNDHISLFRTPMHCPLKSRFGVTLPNWNCLVQHTWANRDEILMDDNADECLLVCVIWMLQSCMCIKILMLEWPYKFVQGPNAFWQRWKNQFRDKISKI